MSKSFRGAFEGTSSETEIRNSIFFCHLKMTRTVEEADQFIRETKKKYRGYTNASAYIVGDGGEQQRARDNGEPNGTGGLPILEAMKKESLVNMTAVVSRKWGGVLLGANRLKIAYGGACSKAIRELGLAEWRLQQEVQLEIDYHFSGQVENELTNMDWVKLKSIDYTDKVTFTCTLDLDNLDKFLEEIADLTNGSAVHTLKQERYMPYPIAE